MLVLGSMLLWVLMLGITILLCIYWLAKFIISIWTGS